MNGVTPEEKSRLLSAAREAVKHAYAPYSGFRVGASVVTESGNIYEGCNVENVSYGLTICAERAAVFHAVTSEGPNVKVRATAIVSDGSVGAPPCGACRQVISEFGPNSLVIYQSNGPDFLERSLGDLLPEQFRLP